MIFQHVCLCILVCLPRMSGAFHCHTEGHVRNLILCTHRSIYGTKREYTIHGLRTLTSRNNNNIHFDGLGVALCLAKQERDRPTEVGGIAGETRGEGLKENVFVYENTDDMDESILEELELGKPSELMIMKDVSSNFSEMCSTNSYIVEGVLSQTGNDIS
jgi:hypothetical protein